MDFLHRNANNQPQQAGRPNGNQAAPSPNASGSESSKKLLERHEPRWLRIIFVVLLFSVTVLAIAIAGLLYIGKDKEVKYVSKDHNQAVFLTNGQVYFGKITSITNEYVNLTGIYYLNSQQQDGNTNNQNNQQTNFSLVKLGCELHGPADQMVINRSQISFWENLKDDGKVAKAIDQFEAQNPNGQTCTDTTDSTTQSQPTSNTKQQ